jgi:hypothetical protein
MRTSLGLVCELAKPAFAVSVGSTLSWRRFAVRCVDPEVADLTDLQAVDAPCVILCAVLGWTVGCGVCLSAHRNRPPPPLGGGLLSCVTHTSQA